MVVLFRLIGRRNGTLAAVVVGGLFLPQNRVSIAAPWQTFYFERQAAIGLALAVAMLVWDARALARFRPKLWDAPFLAFTAWVALVGVAGQYVRFESAELYCQRQAWWLFPYLAGRLYFGGGNGGRGGGDWAGRLLWWVVGATVCLVPVVALEAAFGPSWSLAIRLYGLPSGMQQRRGWRPEAFFDHGLEPRSGWPASVSARGSSWAARGGAAVGWRRSPCRRVACGGRGPQRVRLHRPGRRGRRRGASSFARAFLVALILMVPMYIGLRLGRLGRPRPAPPAEVNQRQYSSVRVRLDLEDLDRPREVHNLAFGYGRSLGVALGTPGVEDSSGAPGARLVAVYLWAFGLVGLVGMCPSC
ncbi:MAG: hypothetical protein U0835_19080 [Isosphaeraceae bacterium]